MRGRIDVVAREHEESDRVAAGRVLSATAAMVVIAAIADRFVAGSQPLRVIPFGGRP